MSETLYFWTLYVLKMIGMIGSVSPETAAVPAVCCDRRARNGWGPGYPGMIKLERQAHRPVVNFSVDAKPLYAGVTLTPHQSLLRSSYGGYLGIEECHNCLLNPRS